MEKLSLELNFGNLPVFNFIMISPHPLDSFKVAKGF